MFLLSCNFPCLVPFLFLWHLSFSSHDFFVKNVFQQDRPFSMFEFRIILWYKVSPVCPTYASDLHYCIYYSYSFTVNIPLYSIFISIVVCEMVGFNDMRYIRYKFSHIVYIYWFVCRTLYFIPGLKIIVTVDWLKPRV